VVPSRAASRENGEGEKTPWHDDVHGFDADEGIGNGLARELLEGSQP